MQPEVWRLRLPPKVEGLNAGLLVHVFASCGAPLAMDDAYLLGRIDHIRNAIHAEEMWVRKAMNGALMGIGKRNKKLNKAAIRAAKAIGPVDVDYGDDNSCEPVDVLEHLTSDYVKRKFEA